MKRPLLAVLPALAALGVVAPARAALPFTTCGSYGFSCARLSVPIDRTGGVPGRISLYVKKRDGTRDSKGVLVVLAGGPGQSATEALRGEGLRFLSPALEARDVIVYDQRGTGRSGLLRCAALERAEIARPGQAAAACARRLGPRRAFYTSRDTADDLEALRRALDVPKLSLFGVSYGTRTAQAYALRYPTRVDRLVLDSVVEPDGYDALARSTFAGVPRVLRLLCGRGCRSFTADPVADVEALVARMARRPVRGTVVDFRGRRRTLSMTGFDLFQVLIAGDFVPPLRPVLPAAVASARDGDPAPLARLVARTRSIQGGAADPSSSSPTLYAATTCEESMLPWARTAPFDGRRAQAAATARAIAPSVFSPFDRATALRSEIIDLCLRWPHAPSAPVPGPGPLPDVPALLIEGEDDLRTPVESARRVARQLPRSQLVVVPGVGHSALAVNTPGCAGRAFAAFMRGRPVSTRCPAARRERPSQPAPESLADVDPPRGLRGMAGRAAAAVGLTLVDVRDDSDASVVRRRGLVLGGGLRSGRYVLGPRRLLRLSSVAFVEGLRVSGRLTAFGTPDQRGALVVTGAPEVRGRLQVRGRSYVGELGGVMVRGRLPSTAPPAFAAAARATPPRRR